MSPNAAKKDNDFTEFFIFFWNSWKTADLQSAHLQHSIRPVLNTITNFYAGESETGRIERGNQR
jgi:hypothetical protein